MALGLAQEELTFTSEEVRRLPWTRLNQMSGVRVKMLWRERGGSSYAGLMRMEPWARIPVHAHRRAAHHLWVETGSCKIGDRFLGPGGYVHVPVGAQHGIEEVGPGGCTFFYLYLVPEIDPG